MNIGRLQIDFRKYPKGKDAFSFILNIHLWQKGCGEI